MTVSEEVDRNDGLNTCWQPCQTHASPKYELLEALQLPKPFGYGIIPYQGNSQSELQQWFIWIMTVSDEVDRNGDEHTCWQGRQNLASGEDKILEICQLYKPFGE